MVQKNNKIDDYKWNEWIDHMEGTKISPRLAKKGIGLDKQRIIVGDEDV